MFGLAAGPTDGQVGPRFDNITWLKNSGTPWDSCYQYLAGGVNTGNGWATWNADGFFATKYLQEADAAGYLPVFTYYQLLQSNPHSGSGESAQDFSNLNNPSTMAAYFADFKLLMQKCGAFGKRVIVHVEPDLWAYLQNDRAGGTDNAANVSAAVASSGFAEAAGLPNSAAGFARCLAKLRDTYAPNVLLAHHASGWATGVDLGSDTRANIDVAAHARRVANFLNSLGAGWELFFYDPLDRDAGFYEFVYGDGGARWWNESDSPTSFPNFARIRQWLAALCQYQNRRCFLWQVPVGNYYYSTCNNTDGHYEDNRAQYFLEGYPSNPHLRQWADAGVIGLLFGRGAGGPTTYGDNKGDGVTNPPRYVNGGGRKSPTNLGNTAAHSDDDGGYLRLGVRAYFAAGPVPLPGTNARPVRRIAVFRPSTREWLLRRADSSTLTIPFGGPDDQPVAADYLGLGTAQIAVFRPGTREWFIRRENGSTLPLTFGGPGDIPVPADYFGLGRAQVAVFRPATRVWFLRTDAGETVQIPFGGPGDIPVPADYFGLSRAQIAVFRPVTCQWFIRRDDGSTEQVQWGGRGDLPVPGDYLGLRRCQIAVYRPGTCVWYLRSDTGAATPIAFGGPGDIPLPDDYLSLGRAQVAVFRPGSREWFIRNDDGSTAPLPWGGPGDVPVPAAYATP
jgi:hypothetical protein